MEKKITYTFTDKDIEMIKTLPENPCFKRCKSEVLSCCGCLEYDKYSNYIQAYKDANILDYAKKYTDMINIQNQIDNLSKQYVKLKLELEEVGIPLKDERYKNYYED